MSHRTRHSAALAAAMLLAGCVEGSGPLQVRENAFSWTDHVPAGATLYVRDLNGDVEVAPGTDDSVRVTARIEWRRGNPDVSLSLSGSRSGNDALICAVWGRKGRCTMETYSAKWDGGRESTDAKVFFKVSLPAGVRLDVQGANGNIVAATSAPVTARTLNGNVTVATAVGPVRGETMNGSVDLRMSSLAGTDSVVAKTINGNAFVYLAEPLDATAELRVVNGSVSTEFPVTITGEPSPRRLSVSFGNGTHPVRLHSVNGVVALRRLDAEGKSHATAKP